MEELTGADELGVRTRFDQLDARIAESAPQVEAILRSALPTIRRLAGSHPHAWPELDCREAIMILRALEALFVANGEVGAQIRGEMGP